MAAPAAFAATITVTTTFDELNADGDCSLREAVEAANTDAAVDACPAGSGADVIQLGAAFYTLFIAGTGEDFNATGDLDLRSDITLIGAGATNTGIVASGGDRVLDVPVPGVRVTIVGVTLRGGAGECFGGGVAMTNAIVTIANSILTDNRAGNGGAISNGGGLLTVDSSTVTGNEGGHRGGGIFNAGTMFVNNSVLTNNHMTFAGGCPGSAFFGGGAAFNEPAGVLTLESSTVSGNTSAHIGGGFLNWTDATLNVNHSTVSGNTANDRGGGIANLGRVSSTNSTISGNRAIQNGGALTQLADTVVLTNTTVSDNTSQNGLGGIQVQGGLPPNLGSTILANSSGGDCSGTLNSLGYNLIEDPSGCAIVGDTTGNITGVDPILGPLASNGGPTLTHALLDGSPAINAASPACPPPATDQRGVLRPQGPRCDIGAFERESAARVAQHFQSYDLGQPERVGETVTLIDQFGSRTVRLEEIEWLMNPVEKRRTGLDPVPIERAHEHLTCYGLPVVSVAERTVHVRNQFVGDSTLRIGRPLTLCTPAAKTTSGTPGSPPEDLDHFQCYDVRGESPRFRSETLTLRDQFGTRTVRIDRTRELCNPVEKRRAGHEPETIKRPGEHLVCYRIETHTPSFSALTVFTNDQFGLDTLRVVSPRRLCVPSEKGTGPLTG